jgi:Ca-activated chloride channel family protein
VLTDGHLNEGITEPDRVQALTRSGFGSDEIRTGCLGFGDAYNEEILAAMSAVGHGQLHDADSAEKFPGIGPRTRWAPENHCAKRSSPR